MPKVEVFEPAMCCSTGVCGPSVDPTLVRFAADMEWLKGQGVAVERYNLSQRPRAFVENVTVRETMKRDTTACLPMILVDGEVAFTAKYPIREQLAGRLGLSVEDDLSLTVLPVTGSSCCSESDKKDGCC
ncbi:MAG TPA: arsenite efflux transporter metallochaperone ArsD [Symbiobacteriaceae bacterium]|nr:arsenite efflux transporter metallochaperone ArsD [Symbiobacteriaceae bacterium]